ncbi:astacin [Necator americanus]|uniref:Metalloendopeptidase n=1 Tax=Necator americanus TaxID=51031 RepID=W2SHG5_NECAM|nr:astacin [Necator americanus]ETN68291.1 astacin [Necator americanus]
MWVLLQFLLLVACARAGGDEFQALGLIYEVNFTALGNIHTELRKMGEQVIDSLKISKKEKNRLKEELEKQDKPLSGLLQDIVKGKSSIFQYVFQGDIILTKEQGDVLQKDIKGLQKAPYLPAMWSKGIKYSFHERANEKLKDAFKRAAKAWQRDTCVNITEDKTKSGDRVVVAGAPFCASYLGKRGGKQVIFLSGFCETFRSAAHELGHTLGLFQQESREDRDDYVKIVTENLEPNQVYMAFKQSQYTNNVSGIGYDFGSIMQAGARREQGEALLKDIKKSQQAPYLPPMWPSIYYSFYEGTKEKLKAVFKRAAEAWHKDTCVNITERKVGGSGDDLVVASAPFCASYLGRRGKKQVIFLSGFCETFRSAAHELGHTLGLFQQESREDRDDYVKIVTENLEPNQVYMSSKQTRNTNNYSDIGYDFGSIMEAGAKSGSINGGRTIDSIDPKYRKNLRSESISFADLYLVNKRYNCSECTFSTTSVLICAMDGTKREEPVFSGLSEPAMDEVCTALDFWFRHAPLALCCLKEREMALV